MLVEASKIFKLCKNATYDENRHECTVMATRLFLGIILECSEMLLCVVVYLKIAVKQFFFFLEMKFIKFS